MNIPNDLTTSAVRIAYSRGYSDGFTDCIYNSYTESYQKSESLAYMRGVRDGTAARRKLKGGL